MKHILLIGILLMIPIASALTFNDTTEIYLSYDEDITLSGGDRWDIDNIYLNNVSSVLTFNETLLNNTIDDRIPIDGSGGSNHVAYWSDANTLTYDANVFYWNALSNSLILNSQTTYKSSPLTLVAPLLTSYPLLEMREAIGTGVEYQWYGQDTNGDLSRWTDGGVRIFVTYDDDADAIFFQELGIQGYDPKDNMGLITGGIGQGQKCLSTSPYTVVDTDHTLYCCAESTVYTVNLPTYRDQNFRELEFKIIEGDCEITIDPYSTENIEGASTYVLNGLYKAIEIHAYDDRTYGGWWITGGYGVG